MSLDKILDSTIVRGDFIQVELNDGRTVINGKYQSRSRAQSGEFEFLVYGYSVFVDEKKRFDVTKDLKFGNRVIQSKNVKSIDKYEPRRVYSSE